MYNLYQIFLNLKLSRIPEKSFEFIYFLVMVLRQSDRLTKLTRRFTFCEARNFRYSIYITLKTQRATAPTHKMPADCERHTKHYATV